MMLTEPRGTHVALPCSNIDRSVEFSHDQKVFSTVRQLWMVPYGRFLRTRPGVG